MSDSDIRYLQRFENFENSFLLLKESVSIDKPKLIEKAGIIQFFEVTFELAWKLLKDYLNHEGYEVKSPRETIKTAFQIDLIKDADIWLRALTDRNLTVHTYDEAQTNEIYEDIKGDYIKIFEQLYLKFKDMQCLD